MFPAPSPAWYKSRTLTQAQSIMDRQASHVEKRPMTNELTLREKVLASDACVYNATPESILDDIAVILEDTGSPAHMRVAKELRGE